ncbi:hypothetical protein ILYODFUR_014135 [Ilyodon furcidens]|uniref:Uncharacterized protein n=1 Tax=Ilyodon furcidens TaxID=33524 RepID=A0ABV0TJX5_9TELE
MMLSTWDYTSSCNTSTAQDPVCGPQLSLQHYQRRQPPPETQPAQSPGLHQSVDHQLSEGPARTGEAGEHLLPHKINKYWRPPLLFSLYTNECISADLCVKPHTPPLPSSTTLYVLWTTSGS